MQKFLLTGLIAAMAVVFIPATSSAAVSAESSAVSAGQVRVLYQNRRYNRYRRPRSVIRTRIVRRGYRVYRERYRITYYPNGRTRIRVLSRVRIR